MPATMSPRCLTRVMIDDDCSVEVAQLQLVMQRIQCTLHDIPASQRTKGHIVWALLFAVFGLLIGLFASEGYVVPIAGSVVGGLIGYFTGKNMEKQKSNG